MWKNLDLRACGVGLTQAIATCSGTARWKDNARKAVEMSQARLGHGQNGRTLFGRWCLAEFSKHWLRLPAWRIPGNVDEHMTKEAGALAG